MPMLTLDATHGSNLALLDGAVFAGSYEGACKRMSAAGWLAAFTRDRRVGRATQRARDGEEGAWFRAADGVVWYLRRVGAEA